MLIFVTERGTVLKGGASSEKVTRCANEIAPPRGTTLKFEKVFIGKLKPFGFETEGFFNFITVDLRT